MKTGLCAALVAALCVAAAPALAASEAEVRCKSVEFTKNEIKKLGAQWIELTKGQWQFLRGVALLSPDTPPGIPPGDKAALGLFGDHGFVFFIDADQACSPMPVPKTLYEFILKADEVNHVGEGM